MMAERVWRAETGFRPEILRKIFEMFLKLCRVRADGRL
jgi:hypothetical protein